MFFILRQLTQGVFSTFEICFRQLIQKSAGFALQPVAEFLPCFGITQGQAAGARQHQAGPVDTLDRLLLRPIQILQVQSR